MNRSSVSQASRRDAARPASGPRATLGVRLEHGQIVVRPLKDGECTHLRGAIRFAEPCDRLPTLEAAVQEAADSLADALRAKAKIAVSVVVRLA